MPLPILKEDSKPPNHPPPSSLCRQNTPRVLSLPLQLSQSPWCPYLNLPFESFLKFIKSRSRSPNPSSYAHPPFTKQWISLSQDSSNNANQLLGLPHAPSTSLSLAQAQKQWLYLCASFFTNMSPSKPSTDVRIIGRAAPWPSQVKTRTKRH